MFGATGGGCDPRKGFDLLTAALEYLGGEVPGVEMVVFGQLAPRTPPILVTPFTTLVTYTTTSVYVHYIALLMLW